MPLARPHREPYGPGATVYPREEGAPWRCESCHTGRYLPDEAPHVVEGLNYCDAECALADAGLALLATPAVAS